MGGYLVTVLFYYYFVLCWPFQFVKMANCSTILCENECIIFFIKIIIIPITTYNRLIDPPSKCIFVSILEIYSFAICTADFLMFVFIMETSTCINRDVYHTWFPPVNTMWMVPDLLVLRVARLQSVRKNVNLPIKEIISKTNITVSSRK